MSPATYHRASRYLHWVMAALILYLVFLGWSFDSDDSGRYARYQMHKSVGILVLFLTFVRIGLRIAYKAPPEMPGPKWQMLAARAVHIGFYVLMIGLPLSGWAMVSASPIGIKTVLFGIIPWPHLPVTPGHDLNETLEAVHGLLAKAMIYLLVPLHIGAALMHHFVHKDDTVTRMLPGLEPKPSLLQSLKNPRWIVPLLVTVGAFAAANLFMKGSPASEAPQGQIEASAVVEESVPELATNLSTASASDTASVTTSSSDVSTEIPTWVVDKSASHIRFGTTFQGSDIKGGFSDYTAKIVFDPERLDGSEVKVTIDLSSVNSGDTDRDATLKGSGFFAVDSHPKAIFEAKSFTKTGEGRYLAKGKLTLHGQTKPFSLPFRLKITDKTAVMTATASLDRLAFGVGSGEWAATDAIPAEVMLDLKITATTK